MSAACCSFSCCSLRSASAACCSLSCCSYTRCSLSCCSYARWSFSFFHPFCMPCSRFTCARISSGVLISSCRFVRGSSVSACGADFVNVFVTFFAFLADLPSKLRPAASELFDTGSVCRLPLPDLGIFFMRPFSLSGSCPSSASSLLRSRIAVNTIIISTIATASMLTILTLFFLSCEYFSFNELYFTKETVLATSSSSSGSWACTVNALEYRI